MRTVAALMAALALSGCAALKASEDTDAYDKARVLGEQSGNVACLVVWMQMAGDRAALQVAVQELKAILASPEPLSEAVYRLPLYFHDPDAQLYVRAALSAILVTFAPDQPSFSKASPAYAGLEALADACSRVIQTEPGNQIH